MLNLELLGLVAANYNGLPNGGKAPSIASSMPRVSPPPSAFFTPTLRFDFIYKKKRVHDRVVGILLDSIHQKEVLEHLQALAQHVDAEWLRSDLQSVDDVIVRLQQPVSELSRPARGGATVRFQR